MEVINLIKVIALFFLFTDVKAFIFDQVDDSNEKTINVMNFKYNPSCLKNETIESYLNTFRTKYDEIKDMDDDKFLNSKWSTYSIHEVCNSKRNKARSITDFIHHIANECVKNEKLRKRFILNTLLSLEFILDFTCNIRESVYNSIYINHVSDCASSKVDLLDKCRNNSFKVFFFDKIPNKMTVMHLLNGGICNFDYDAMKKCSEKPLETCSGASETLNYLLDIIKRNSICYKRRNVSDIIDSSRDSLDP